MTFLRSLRATSFHRPLAAQCLGRAGASRGILLAPSYDKYIALPSHEGPQFDAIYVGGGYRSTFTPSSINVLAAIRAGSGVMSPWNMSRRAEVKLGPRLKVAAVIDPDAQRAQTALAGKSQTFVADTYNNTVVLPDIAAYAQKVKDGDAPEPKAIFVASPPQYRGGLEKHNDLEIQINKYFPNANFFVEKPVSTGVPWDKSIEQAKEVGRIIRTKQNGIVGVGYCLRYLKAVQEMKRIIDENNLTVMATFGRYIMAYELAIKQDWWRTSGCQGPIIENGTHLCDLVRYFGGDIDLDTLVAHAVEADEKPGQLSKTNFDDASIPLEDKIPRVTCANWKYKSGAVGALLHGTILHGVDYSIELEVYADGYQLILQDPYGTPSLSVRKSGAPSDDPVVTSMDGDDPYQTEMSNFIDAIEGGPDPRILSTYEDAAKSYEFTWAVRRASEESTRRRREKNQA